MAQRARVWDGSSWQPAHLNKWDGTQWVRVLNAGIMDSFNRADPAPELGTTDTGETWVRHDGVWGIALNKARCSTLASSQGVVSVAATADINLRATIESAGTNQAGVLFRGATLAHQDHLMARYNHTIGQVQLYKRVSSTYTLLASTAVTLTPTYDIQVLAVGSAVQVLIGGVSRITHTLSGGDMTLFGTRIRAGLRASAIADRFENFAAFTA